MRDPPVQQGEGVQELRKGSCANHVRDVAALLRVSTLASSYLYSYKQIKHIFLMWVVQFWADIFWIGVKMENTDELALRLN